MTTEQKALALVNAENLSTHHRLDAVYPGQLKRALIAAIEAHEADKKAFSDAVEEALDVPVVEQNVAHILLPFIIPDPEPDPLVALMAFNGLDETLAEQRAANLRKDATDLGYKIIVERIDHD